MLGSRTACLLQTQRTYRGFVKECSLLGFSVLLPLRMNLTWLTCFAQFKLVPGADVFVRVLVAKSVLCEYPHTVGSLVIWRNRMLLLKKKEKKETRPSMCLNSEQCRCLKDLIRRRWIISLCCFSFLFSSNRTVTYSVLLEMLRISHKLVKLCVKFACSPECLRWFSLGTPACSQNPKTCK